MRLIAISAAVSVGLACACAWAADTGAADERQKLIDAGAQFMLGKYDDALEAAKVLLRTTKDDTIKASAARLVAESLRKKGEWKAAASAYLKLKDYYPKGSDDYVRYEATAEVLQASPTGLYPPLEAANAKSGAATAATGAGASAGAPDTASTAASGGEPAAKPAVVNLADDDYLARALACLAAIRVEKLKARAASIKKARTPQEAQAAFAAVVEEMRQARALSSAVSGEAGDAAAKATSDRLAELGRNVIATLTAKLAEFQASIRNRSLTLAQRKEMGNYETLCKDLSKTEAAFQGAVSALGASDSGSMRTDSAERQAEYDKLARAFVPPPMEPRDWGGFGGFGGGFGGPGRGGGGRGW